MKFALYKASDRRFNENVEINTFEELLELSKQYTGYDLIVSVGESKSITIYDDYME